MKSQSDVDNLHEGGTFTIPTPWLGLNVLFAVIAVLFLLLSIAYYHHRIVHASEYQAAAAQSASFLDLCLSSGRRGSACPAVAAVGEHRNPVPRQHRHAGAAKCDTAGPGGLGAGLPADCRGADDGFPGGPDCGGAAAGWSRILRGNDASSGVLPDHRPAARAPCVWRSVAAWPGRARLRARWTRLPTCA